MSQEEIRKHIDSFKKNVEECDTSSIILSGTATGTNVSSYMLGKIDGDIFKKNAADIALIAIDYIEKCKCEKI